MKDYEQNLAKAIAEEQAEIEKVRAKARENADKDTDAIKSAVKILSDAGLNAVAESLNTDFFDGSYQYLGRKLDTNKIVYSENNSLQQRYITVKEAEAIDLAFNELLKRAIERSEGKTEKAFLQNLYMTRNEARETGRDFVSQMRLAERLEAEAKAREEAEAKAREEAKVREEAEAKAREEAEAKAREEADKDIESIRRASKILSDAGLNVIANY